MSCGHAGSPVSLPMRAAATAPRSGGKIASQSPLGMGPRQTAGAVSVYARARRQSNRRQRSTARMPEAAGRGPARPPGSRRGGRRGRPAPTGRPPGRARSVVARRLRDALAVAATTASANAGCRSKRSRLPRSVPGWPACANSQSSTPGDLERVGVDQQVLGVQVAVHQAGARSTGRAAPGASCATSTRASYSVGDQWCRATRWASTQASRSAAPSKAPIRSSASTKVPRRSIGMPPRVAATSPTARPRRSWPAASSSGSTRSPRTPGQERGDQQRRLVAPRALRGVPPGPRGPAAGRAPAAAARHRSRRPGRRGRRRARAGRSAPPAARRRPRRGRSARTSRRRAASTRRSPLAR